MKRHAGFQLVQAIEAEEREHTQITGERREFYHPGYSANGSLLGDGTFKPSGVPEGFALDVAGWERRGCRGPADLKQASAAAEVAPKKPRAPRRRDARGRFLPAETPTGDTPPTEELTDV